MNINPKDILFTLLTIIFSIYMQFASYGVFGLDIYSNKEFYILIYSVLLVFIGIVKLDKHFFYKKNIFLLLILSSIVSRLVIKEYPYIIYLISMFIGGTILMNLPKKYSEIFIDVLFFTSIPFVFVFFGKVYNSFAVVEFFIIMTYILKISNGQSFKFKLVYIYLLLFFMNIVTLFTQSRTVFLMSVISTILIYLFFLKSDSLIQRIGFLGILGSVLFLISFKFDALLDFINKYFIKKWEYNPLYYKKSNTFLGDRGYIWQDVLNNNSKLFGQEHDFFSMNYSLRDSHNIFIQTLGIYGVITSIILILFVIYVFILCIKQNNKQGLVFLLAYIGIGMTENILFFETRFIIVSVLFYIVLGQLFYYDRRFKN